MTVVVSFCKAKGVRGSAENPAIASVRVREDLELDDVSIATVAEREIVVIGNNEESAIAVAFGTAPDATATEQTPVSTAGMPVQPGHVISFAPPVGSRVSVGALT